MNYSLISNSCVSGFVYQLFNPGVNKMFVDYTNPFIASWFPEDEQYIKFCERYDYYTSLEPRFDEPTTCRKWHQDTGSYRILNRKIGFYPVMFLGDIEIHWIHETDTKLLMRKYTERLKISQELEPVFLWSDPEMFNIHTELERIELVLRFNDIPKRTIFLTKYKRESFGPLIYVPEWEGKLQTDRHRQNFMITWYTHLRLAELYKENL